MKIDPRNKILIVALISTLAVLLTSWIDLLLLFIVSLIIGIILKVSYREFARRAKYLLIVVMSLTILQSIFTRAGEPLVSIYSFVLVTDYGLDMGLQFILRMSVIISSAMIIATSNIKEITDALIKLKIPYELAFMMSIGIRFLPDIRQDLMDRKIALQLRGVDIKSLNIGKKIKAYSYLMAPAVNASIIRSQMLAISVESRGFRAHKSRTMLRNLRFSMMDYIFMITSTLAFLIAIYIVFFGGN